jgi:hypothetical protein
MSKAFVIEFGSRTAGIVVQDGPYYRFHAATHEYNALDGCNFRSPRQAEKAVHSLSLSVGKQRLRGHHRYQN